MTSYKDGEVLIPEQDYAPVDRARRAFARSICDDAIRPGWLDSLDIETKGNVIDAVLAAFEQGCDE